MLTARDWPLVQALAGDILALDPGNPDAQDLRWAAMRRLAQAPQSPRPEGEGQGEGQPRRQQKAKASSARAPGPRLFAPGPRAACEALAHLDFAIAEFREIKMQPSLERALRHKELLKA